ncbi:MAG: hypothetical protein GEU28_08640 [Dehalococcoidia bacterium]|nr:hypothetical protein [Dehalococcoidia bacterium]
MICRDCRHTLNTSGPGRWIAQAPGNNRIRGYHLSQLYSPWANLRAMIEASEETTPAAIQEFQNSDLGEAFVPPGGGLSVDVIDRCRDGYGLDEYAGQECTMGVDVGIRLHVVVRERCSKKGQRGSCGQPHRLWFAGEATWDDLLALVKRFNVQQCLIDAQPEMHMASQFVRGNPGVASLAQYGRHENGHHYQRGDGSRPNVYHINRPEAMDEVMQRFHDRLVLLPRDARGLGGRVRDGLGDYYRQILAPKRTLEQDAQGNWVSRWVDNGKADHYAHAELYCMMAERIDTDTWTMV